MTVKTRMLLILAALFGVLACSATPASAEALSPWFHLASVSRPGSLGSSAAQDEVQEITTEPGAVFQLSVDHKPAGVVAGFIPEGFFEAAPYPGPFGGFAPQATAANVQVALEAVYGAGNVEVTGGVPPATGTGKLEEESTKVTEVNTTTGMFEVGQPIGGAGILSGTTIAAVGNKTVDPLTGCRIREIW